MTLGDGGLPATVTKIMDVGRHAVVEAHIGDIPVKAVVGGAVPAIGSRIGLQFDRRMTRLYRDGRIASIAEVRP